MTWNFRDISLRAVACLHFAGTARAGPWRPAGEFLPTPWSKDVTPDKVLPEYPRPQMTRASWVNLNGLWDYAIAAQGATGQGATGPAAYDGTILVPFPLESALSGVGKRLAPGQALIYHRRFDRPVLDGGQRLLLHFGAVDWHTTVLVNGRPVGEHRGGYDPFTFDITDALTAGGPQELVVEVVDPSDAGYQLAGKQCLAPPNKCYYTPVSGIWQTVWLETVAETHVTAVLAEADPSLNGFVVRVAVEGPGKAEKLTVALRDGARSIGRVEGEPGRPLQLAVADPAPWSPESPHLYDLEVSLPGGDRVRSYCALRRIEVKADGRGRPLLSLNGRVGFQFGPLDQGYWPDGLYTAPTDDALRSDIEAMKRMGFNVVRKHMKVEPARWYYWCDKLGLMVWQDIPSARGLRGEEGRENFDREAGAIIESLRPFPSIVTWVVFNEGWGQRAYGLDRSRELIDRVAARDPARLVDGAGGWTDVGGGHLADLHVYPMPAMPPADATRAQVVGEFGGLGWSVKDHTWRAGKGGREPSDDAELRENYARLVPALRLCRGQGLAGGIYTQLTDVEGELNGYLTYDRRVNKLGEAWLRALHEEIFAPPPDVRTLAGGAVPWAVTTRQPPSGWREAGFDDSAWDRGIGPFGANYRGMPTRTPWGSPGLWMRCSFDLPRGAGEDYLFVRAVRGAEVRVALNGTPLPEDTPGLGSGLHVPLGGLGLLKAGRNVIGVEVRRGDDDRAGRAALDVRLLCARPGQPEDAPRQ